MASFFSKFFKKKKTIKIELIFSEFSPIENDKTPDQPYFRFNPTAYDENGSLNASDIPCDVCKRESDWICEVVIPNINTCARCISNNDLTRYVNDRHFVLVGDITLSANVSEKNTYGAFLKHTSSF